MTRVFSIDDFANDDSLFSYDLGLFDSLEERS